MHLKQISRDLRRKLYGSRAEYRGGGYYGGGNWHEGLYFLYFILPFLMNDFTAGFLCK